MYTKILEYKVFNKSKKELMDCIKKYKKLHIISGNPEVLSNGLNNKDLFDNFTSENSIIIPDGIGTVIASKIIKKPVKEKIAGIEVMESLLKVYSEEGKSIYLLGTKEEVLKKCVLNLNKKYPKLNIAGSHNGFFDMNDCSEIVENVKNSHAKALFVAMGSPRQEIFISKYMEQLNCEVFMGVGGSLDIFAGELKRAPKWMINLGLEWMYRVAKEPWRLKRLGSIPKFIMKVAKNN